MSLSIRQSHPGKAIMWPDDHELSRGAVLIVEVLEDKRKMSFF